MKRKRIPIRDLHSGKPVQPRFCDLVIEDDKIYLEQKTAKNEYSRIQLEDFQYQVDVAMNTDET